MICPGINNTTIIGTSGISYDAPPLPCTDVSTCDGLNLIFSKFDTIICSVIDDVDEITTNITNLNEQLVTITDDIVNINEQLNICCPTTTTTTTVPPTTTTTTSSSTTTTTSTTLPPTTTTTSSSSTSTTSTSTSTTSTTSTSSTTTTTTTSIPLLCFQLEIYPPLFNPGTFHVVQYLDCRGNIEVESVPSDGEMVTVCYTAVVSDNFNGVTIPLYTYC